IRGARPRRGAGHRGASRVSERASPAPVIAIDGPTASGKGTVAQRVARALGWHYLDSGSLYRLAALGALRGMAGPVSLVQGAGGASEAAAAPSPVADEA